MIREPVGDARDADAVVRAWAITPGDEGPVAVAVVREVVAADEVVAAHEAAAVEVGRAQVAAVRRGPVGDPGVEHRDGHALAARRCRRRSRCPRRPATLIPNGPTKFHCSAGPAAVPAAGIVRREGGRAWRRSSAARGRRAGRVRSFAAASRHRRPGRLDPLGAGRRSCRRTRTPAARRIWSRSCARGARAVLDHQLARRVRSASRRARPAPGARARGPSAAASRPAVLSEITVSSPIGRYLAPVRTRRALRDEYR